MSAYVCDPAHVGLLATYAAVHGSGIPQWTTGTKFETCQLIAAGLMAENIRSVAHRYPRDKDGERPGRCLKDAEFIELAQHYAAHYLTKPVSTSPVMILKMIACLDYQSCETEDWERTPACRQLMQLQHLAISQLPGYENAPWEYHDLVEEVESLVVYPV